MGNKRKIWLSFVPLFLIVAFSFFFYQRSFTQAGYQGLPTVPCLDYTKQVLQDYSLHISISILGKVYPIPKTYGRDYGQCLHDIYANGSSGRILVKTNEFEAFDLGNFFDVWRASFNKNQIFGYESGNGHALEVFINGQKVNTYRNTPLFPDSDIEVVYK